MRYVKCLNATSLYRALLSLALLAPEGTSQRLTVVACERGFTLPRLVLAECGLTRENTRTVTGAFTLVRFCDLTRLVSDACCRVRQSIPVGLVVSRVWTSEPPDCVARPLLTLLMEPSAGVEFEWTFISTEVPGSVGRYRRVRT